MWAGGKQSRVAPGLTRGEGLVLVWTAHLLLLLGKVEIINAREVAPGLASEGMFKSPEQSQKGEVQVQVWVQSWGELPGRHGHAPV